MLTLAGGAGEGKGQDAGSTMLASPNTTGSLHAADEAMPLHHFEPEPRTLSAKASSASVFDNVQSFVASQQSAYAGIVHVLCDRIDESDARESKLEARVERLEQQIQNLAYVTWWNDTCGTGSWMWRVGTLQIQHPGATDEEVCCQLVGASQNGTRSARLVRLPCCWMAVDLLRTLAHS